MQHDQAIQVQCNLGYGAFCGTQCICRCPYRSAALLHQIKLMYILYSNQIDMAFAVLSWSVIVMIILWEVT
jgi:hypothetical protein